MNERAWKNGEEQMRKDTQKGRSRRPPVGFRARGRGAKEAERGPAALLCSDGLGTRGHAGDAHAGAVCRDSPTTSSLACPRRRPREITPPSLHTRTSWAVCAPMPCGPSPACPLPFLFNRVSPQCPLPLSLSPLAPFRPCPVPYLLHLCPYPPPPCTPLTLVRMRLFAVRKGGAAHTRR